MLRSIEQWMEILGRQDATYISAEEAIANRILGDLVGYRHSYRMRQEDVKQLSHAIQAYARMLQSAGVKA